MRTQERVNSMNDIIVGIARRSAYKFKTRSAEDLAQELWVKILEKEERLGYDLDLDLIAHICYDTIVDIQRYDMKRNSYSLDEILERCAAVESGHSSKTDNQSDDPWTTGTQIFSGKIESTDNVNRILIDELLKVFPEGSKERFFLEYWSTAVRYRDYGIDGGGKNCDGFTESDLARQLGFPGTGSYAFKSFRRKMREFVKEFIGD